MIANDSTAAGTPSTIATYFLAGERASSWFTSPCEGTVVGVQVYWASVPGNTGMTSEESITFYAAGDFPMPGEILQNVDASHAVIPLPPLLDGLMNDFRFLDPPSNSIPIEIPVAAAETFSVGVALRNPSAEQPLAPGVASDMDGCQPGTNAVEVIPDGWSDACALGVAGDWVIRAVVECSSDAGMAAISSTDPGPAR